MLLFLFVYSFLNESSFVTNLLNATNEIGQRPSMPTAKTHGNVQIHNRRFCQQQTFNRTPSLLQEPPLRPRYSSSLSTRRSVPDRPTSTEPGRHLQHIGDNKLSTLKRNRCRCMACCLHSLTLYDPLLYCTTRHTSAAGLFALDQVVHRVSNLVAANWSPLVFSSDPDKPLEQLDIIGERNGF